MVAVDVLVICDAWSNIADVLSLFALFLKNKRMRIKKRRRHVRRPPLL